LSKGATERFHVALLTDAVGSTMRLTRWNATTSSFDASQMP
jgi:hypothetical protein